MRRLLLVPLVPLALLGCSSGGDGTATSAAPTAPPTIPAPLVGQFSVEPLGITFDLGDSFSESQDDQLEFYARSDDPPALITIALEGPAVVDHTAEAGETLSDGAIPGVESVVVTGAVLEGLPAGISSNELLVSNGDRSFSVIMSAPDAEIAALWDRFLSSLQVTPEV